MTEETEVQENIEQKNQEQVLDPVVIEAKAQGWVPKEEFDGDEHKWVDAGEFLRRGELFKKIDQVSRTAKHAEQTLAKFKEHYAKVRETEYQRALSDLKAERRSAMAEGDFSRVEDIEEKIDTVKAESVALREELVTPQPQEQLHPDVANWIDKNKWYATDSPMKAYTDSLAMQLHNEGITGKPLLDRLDVEVRKAFPHKFSNPNRERVGNVESSTTRGNKSKDTFELSEQEQRICNTFVRDGVMTRDEYIADLKKIKGIKP